MPPPPPNPTWAQIETGLTLAGERVKNAKAAAAIAKAEARQQQRLEQQALEEERDAESEYNAWIAAVRRKVLE